MEVDGPQDPPEHPGSVGGEVELRPEDLDETAEAAERPSSPPGVEVSSEAEFIAAAFETHSGPMPSQRWLEGAEKLHVGATKILLDDFQQERAHQREMQAQSLQLDKENLREFASYQRLRLLIVGGLAGFLAIAGVALIFAGKPISGFALLAGEIAAVVAAFFGRKRFDEASDDHS